VHKPAVARAGCGDPISDDYSNPTNNQVYGAMQLRAARLRYVRVSIAIGTRTGIASRTCS
jgi:hypothetical protein